MEPTVWNLHLHYIGTATIEAGWDLHFQPEVGMIIDKILSGEDSKDIKLTNLYITLEQYPLQYEKIANAVEVVLPAVGITTPRIAATTSTVLRDSLRSIIQQRSMQLFYSIEVASYFCNTLSGPYTKSQLIDEALSVLKILETIKCTDQKVIDTCNSVLDYILPDIPTIGEAHKGLPTVKSMMATLYSGQAMVLNQVDHSCFIPLPNASWNEWDKVAALPPTDVKPWIPPSSSPIFRLLQWIQSRMTPDQQTEFPSNLTESLRYAFISAVVKFLLGENYIETTQYLKVLELLNATSLNPILWTAMLKALLSSAEGNISKVFLGSHSMTAFEEFSASAISLLELTHWLKGTIGEHDLIHCGLERVVDILWTIFWEDETLTEMDLIPTVRRELHDALEITKDSALTYHPKLLILASITDLHNLSKFTVLEGKTDLELQSPFGIPGPNQLSISNFGRYLLVALSSLRPLTCSVLWEVILLKVPTLTKKGPLAIKSETQTRVHYLNTCNGSIPQEMCVKKVRDDLALRAKMQRDSIHNSLKRHINRSSITRLKV